MPLRPYVYDGSGGLLTNLLDYAQWDAALRSDFLLSAEIKEKMWTKFSLNDGSEGNYGFGWFHGGSTQGFTSHIVRGRESAVTVFVFRNGSGNQVQSLTRDIFTAYKQQMPAQRKAG